MSTHPNITGFPMATEKYVQQFPAVGNNFPSGINVSQVIAIGDSPTYVAGDGAGVGAQVGVGGLSNIFRVQIQVGTNPQANAAIVGIDIKRTFPNDLIGLFSPGDPATARMPIASIPYLSCDTDGNVILMSNSTALPAGTYQWNVFVAGF